VIQREGVYEILEHGARALPFPFWRMSLAALSSGEPGERRVSRLILAGLLQ
jgi:hypothetical protein